MGVEYRGLLILGYDWGTVEEILPGANYQGAFEDEQWENMDTQEQLEYLNLDGRACCYDGGREDSVFGWSIAKSGWYSFDEVSDEQVASIEQKTIEMTATYGVKPKLYVMAQGY